MLLGFLSSLVSIFHPHLVNVPKTINVEKGLNAVFQKLLTVDLIFTTDELHRKNQHFSILITIQ